MVKIMFKIVIAEDEFIVRKGLVETVDWEKIGCDVVYAAENGLKAYQYIKDNDVNLLITDIRMPKMDGLKLIESLLMLENKNISFIVLSAYNEFSYAQEAIKLGVMDYILKPFKVDDLLVSVEKAKKNKAKQDKLKKYMITEQTYQINNQEIMRKIINVDDINDIQLNKIVRFIHHNYTNPDLTLSDIADHAELSQSHLSRIFKQYFKISYQEYLTNYRLFKACYLLENTDLKIYEVAKLSGYLDQKYFSSLFKKHTGFSPLEYKNINQGRQQL